MPEVDALAWSMGGVSCSPAMPPGADSRRIARSHALARITLGLALSERGLEPSLR